LPLGEDTATWRAKRDDLLEHIPWVDRSLFDLRRRDEFKDHFACAVCCALPAFDLVVIDEGHNLKGALGRTSARNRVLASRGPGSSHAFRGYGSRAKRFLILSTPLENDYRHLWNQLDVIRLRQVEAARRLKLATTRSAQRHVVS
jgi:hypothetical protein